MKCFGCDLGDLGLYQLLLCQFSHLEHRVQAWMPQYRKDIELLEVSKGGLQTWRRAWRARRVEQLSSPGWLSTEQRS